jgi:hypothetical protein
LKNIRLDCYFKSFLAKSEFLMFLHIGERWRWDTILCSEIKITTSTSCYKRVDSCFTLTLCPSEYLLILKSFHRDKKRNTVLQLRNN